MYDAFDGFDMCPGLEVLSFFDLPLNGFLFRFVSGSDVTVFGLLCPSCCSIVATDGRGL
jgi:hypothetical protein